MYLNFTLTGFLLAAALGAEAQPADRTPSGPFTPAESLSQFRVAEDLEIQLLLAEPLVAQPVFLNFDERGRLWVVEYRQYPDPAGLRMVSHDSVWRVVYDKIPHPPPNHVRGLDRITIHEDTDGDGRFDKHKTFVDGLNIATAVERGRGGVWVLNAPYLLFYPDVNDDDIPDSDPIVHLSGFGLEDTHSVVNSLRWGPDGWLYGAQGSTVTANVVRPGVDEAPLYSQGQNIWRYHPETRRYEVFAEGGGNAFGVELDSKARLFSGHNGGDTRGFHYVQGGYLRKGFEKHGPLSNPYAYGYFEAMTHPKVERFTHNFVLYDGGALPDRYQGKLFGIEPLQGRVVLSQILPDQSTFRSTDLGHPVTTSDRWFRPVDIKAGPDGALYLCDWYDQQVNHYRNHEGQIDPKTGRIYRLKGKNAPTLAPFNLAELSSSELVELLGHRNKWHRQTALRLMADRRDRSLISRLAGMMEDGSGQLALESLWALNLCGGLTEQPALKALDHPDPFVRLWTVRLLCDQRNLSSVLAERLTRLAAAEGDLEVRSQLACSARRLPASQGLAIVRNLLNHDEDATDGRLPLLLWWAIEARAESDREAVLAMFEESPLWGLPLVRDHLLGRIIRRYAQAGSRKDLLACARLFYLAPSAEDGKRLMAGFEEGAKGSSWIGLPEELLQAMGKHSVNPAALGLRQGQPQAVESALSAIADPKADVDRRLQYLLILSEVDLPASVPVLLGLLDATDQPALRKAALTALLRYSDPQIGERVLNLYNRLDPDVRRAAQTLLTSRDSWSLQLVRAVKEKRIQTDAVPPAVVQAMGLHRDSGLLEQLQEIWGTTGSPTSTEMEQTIHHLAKLIDQGVGDPYNGRSLFNSACASCHTLFSGGGKIGPDLTVFQRSDLPNMLLSIVNPSAEIREGYESYVVETTDERSLTGFLVEQDDRTVVLRGLDGQNLTLPREQIAEMKGAALSLMPGGLLEAMNDQQVRDLFAYLRSTQPLVGSPPGQ